MGGEMSQCTRDAERASWLAPTASWVWLVDGEGRILGANATSGVSRGTLADVIDPTDLPALQRCLPETAATCVTRLQGGLPAVAWRVERAGDVSVLVGKSLTPAQVALEIDRARRHLVQRLVTAMAHDASNSLGAIRSNVQYVQVHRASREPTIEPEVALALADSVAGCDEVVHLARSLRLLAEGVSMEPPALDHLVRATVSLASQPVRSRVRLRLGKTVPVAWAGNRQHLLHALIELVQWGVRLAEPGTDVVLSLPTQEPQAVLSYVEGSGDTGPLPWVLRVLRDRLGMQLRVEPGRIYIEV